MQSRQYQNYINSEKWKQIKEERLKIDGYSCVMCGYNAKTEILMVHHLTYKNLEKENVWQDLVTLCPICHKKIHKMLNRKQRPEKLSTTTI